ncbi:hypothetical protein SAMN02745121_02787 [Nannocystis exedens]|uniref:Uncharacterized protein n=1 Tax=Nannocystis exedens TaxID=54 RepID=A0A1I1XE67_9BACT|nr:hypothetical protein NAEX_03809 [Nannocystis exedens]SFE03670.1 hypothetical protein SAMN02745121_02787 [Nannocystis exedens]
MMRALEPKPLLHCNAFSRFATAIYTPREIEYFLAHPARAINPASS